MKKDTPEKPLAVIETRVSDKRQLDGSHDQQEKECRKLVAELGADVDKVWRTTASGSIEDRDNFADILKHIDVQKGRVKYYVCYSIERFTRAGPSTYEIMKKELQKRGVQMRDVDRIIQPDRDSMESLGFEYPSWSRYSPSGTSELVEAGKGRDNKRIMLTRMIGQEIINANEGYAVHSAPDGFINKREEYCGADGKRKHRTTRLRDTTRLHRIERASFYEKIFELRVLGQMTDKKIAEEVNKMGYLSKIRWRWNKEHTKKVGTIGGVPLTVKRLQAIIQLPVYAGVNYEVWTQWKPIRAQYAGLVSIKTWNDANRGRRYIEEMPGGSLVMHKDYVPENRTHDNPLYPYKEVILCPMCRKPFHGSASRNKAGKHFPAYHCDRKINGKKHERMGANKYAFETQVEDFVNNLQFQQDQMAGFKLVLMDTFNRKQAGATEAATEAGKRVTELQEQKQATIRAYIAACAMGDEELKRDIQIERSRIEQQVQVAQGYRDTLEVNELDLQEFTYRIEWIMEHPQEFLLRAGNKEQRRAYFSLMFAELPTYQDVKDGTPKLAWVFKLDDSPMMSESDKVRSARFELATFRV
ncbi:MAG: recombinase family protein [Candidatus Zambryskibacteria bacterium]|nr:recombinase family protein [Candidatus Zambryskibacteria bacterium]